MTHHLYRDIYHHGKNCCQCLKTGKNLKVILGASNTEKLSEMKESNKETNLDCAGSMENNWGVFKYLLPCIDRYSKVSSAKVLSSNSSDSSVLSFLTDYCSLHRFPKSIIQTIDRVLPRMISKISARRTKLI